MANRKIIKRNKSSYSYTIPSHYGQKYALGGDILKGLKGGASIIGTTAGQAGGTLIGGGLESGVGSGISNIGGTVGSAVGAVNPLLGGIISASSGIIGGLTNRAFGSKMNTEKINQIDSSNKALSQLQVDSSTNDSIAGQWSTTDFGKDFSQSDVGKDGWFSSKAANKYNELKLQQDTARNRALMALQTGVTVADTNQDQALARNFSAFGGPIDIKDNMPMSPFGNRFADGGSIDINPANKGKFNATKKRTGKTTEELTHSKNPVTKKRAIFAQNASHWHALGGVLQGDGADWDEGITPINNGGTHEENPNEGVQMGVDEQGTPNLVEEGEVKWNNYIFSNRLAINKELLLDSHLPTSLADHTFASAAEKVGKESKERPNDPISQRGLNDSLTKLATAQEAIRQKEQQENMKKRKFSQGGNLYAYGTPLSPQYFGLPKNQEIYPTLSTSPSTTAKMQGISAQIAKNATQIATQSSPSSTGENGLDTSYLRYAPVIGSGVAALSDAMGWTNKPNYVNADRIEDSANGIKPVTYTPIGDKLTYNPFDKNYYLNKLNAEAGATRRGIIDQAGGNRATAMANLLAVDYNSQGKVGDLARQAEEYNQGLKERVATFNRSTNQFNAEQDTRAQMANLDIAKMRMTATAQASAMREEAAAKSAAARSANLTNFFNNLGGVGQESFARNMVNGNKASYHGIDSEGNTYYKKNNSKACGGMLTIKKSRRK